MNPNHRPANFLMTFLPQNGSSQFNQNVQPFNQTFSHNRPVLQPPPILRQHEQRLENYTEPVRPNSPVVQNKTVSSPSIKQTNAKPKQSIQTIAQLLMAEMTKCISEITKVQVEKIIQDKQTQEKTKRQQKKQQMKKYSKSKNEEKSDLSISEKKTYNRHSSMQTPIIEPKILQRYDGQQIFQAQLELFNKAINRQKSEFRDYLSTNWRQSKDHQFSLRQSQYGEQLIDSMKQLVNEIKKLGQNKKENRSIFSTVEYGELPIDERKRSFFLKQNASKILSQILSVSFNMYFKDGMDFEKVKAYCCQNMLINFCKLVNIMKMDRRDMKMIQEHLQQDVLPFLNLSYPRSQQKFFNKQLKGKIDEKDIFNENRFDIVYNSKVPMSIKQKQTNSEVMKIMNYIISLPDSYPEGKQILNLSSSYVTENKQKTLYQNFVEDMSTILSRVYKKDLCSKLSRFFRVDRFAIRDAIFAKKQKFSTTKQLLQIIDKHIFIYCQQFEPRNSQTSNYRIQYHLKQKEQQQYKQKVQSYTKMKIGRKIQTNVQPYSEQQIEEGALKIKDSSIARVLVKWVEALQKQIRDPTKATYLRGEPFRLNNQDQTYFLSREVQLHKLCKFYERSASVIKEKSEILKNNARQIFLQALKSSQLTKFKSYQTFSSQNEAKIGHICTLIQKCKQNHISSYLNMLLGQIKCIEQEYQWLIDDKNTTLYSRPSLITMKLGDLMRCQITSKPKQIIALYEYICLVCKCDPARFQMVRIKDRSDTTNKDILINVFYYKKVMIQIQLAIKNDSNFISCSDMFSHFIYEMNRAFLGPINQMCNIWSHYSPKAQFYTRKFLQINVKAQQVFKPKCNDENGKHEYEDQRKGFKLPFWCSTCGVMFYNDSMNRTICKRCGKYKCDMCRVREGSDYFIKQNYPTFQILKVAPELGRIYYALDIGTNHKHIKGLMIMEINGKTQSYSMKIEPDPNKDEKDEFLINRNIVISNIEAQFQVQKRKNTKNMKKQLFQQQHIILKKKIFTNIGKKFEQKLQEAIYQSIIRDYYLPKVIKSLTKKSQKYLKISLITNPVLSPEIKGKLVSKILTKNQRSLEFIEKLSLNQNGLRDLRIDGLLPLVRAIALYHNELKILKLSGFRNLVTLQLSQNKIQSFHQLQNLFECTNMIRIYLDQNQIKSMEGFPTQLRKLQVLSLRKNVISNIKDMPRLLSLKCLNLNENRVSSLNGLENVESLQQLRLKGNTFLGSQGIDCLKQLKQLKKLDLSSTNTSKNMFPSTILRPNGQYQQIFIEGPIDPKLQVLIVLNGLTLLQQLDISDNGLKTIPQLAKLSYLKQLNVCKNFLKSVKNIEFLGSLTWLSLKQNQITSLKGLRRLTHLRWLDLSDNDIEYQQLVQLSFIYELHEVSINQNLLKSLQGIGNIKMLQQLNIKGNQVESLTGLNKLTSLQHLDAESNQLQNLAGLQNLQLLQDLKLSRNPLMDFSVISNLQNLKILQLNAINLQQIAKIPRLKNLQELYLNHNKLESLVGIQNFQSLKKLQIKLNKITSLQGLKKLKFLTTLSFSMHPKIDLNLIKDGQSLTTLKIQKNQDTTEEQQQILIAFVLIGYDIQFV